MSFGNRLKHLRESHKLSREVLAQKLGLSYWALSKYETGARTPDPDTINKIADFFGVSTDYLLGRIDKPTNEENFVVNNDEIDLKKELQEKKIAHWGGYPLTEDERKVIQRIIEAVIKRDEESASLED